MNKKEIDYVMDKVKRMAGCHAKLKGTEDGAMLTIIPDKSGYSGVPYLEKELLKHGIVARKKHTQDGWVLVVMHIEDVNI